MVGAKKLSHKIKNGAIHNHPYTKIQNTTHKLAQTSNIIINGRSHLARSAPQSNVK
jgi:hypothetical protein